MRKRTQTGNYAFGNCTGLTEINYNATACSDLSSKSNVFSNAGQSGNGITVNVGENVTKIPAYLFSRSSAKITSVVFAENSVCTSIGNSAFSNCSELTSIVIPDSVTSIGKEAFEGCSGLTSVHIIDIAKWCDISFGNDSANPLSYAHSLYLNGELVTDLVIPDSVTSIDKYAFYDCSGLTSVTIGSSVTSIGSYAFSGCTGLTSVTFTDTTTWYRTYNESNWENKTGGTQVEVTDSSTNATYFKSTYKDYYWYKKD